MQILITGFEPFGGESVNPAWLAVDRLKCDIPGVQLQKMLLPVCFEAAGESVRDALNRLQPDAILMVGQAGGRKSIAVETTAVNLDNTNAPDNAGYCPKNLRIVPDGPDTLPATIPVEKVSNAINALNIPAELSGGAGTYVCNHIMYCAFHTILAKKMACRAGFIHVPFLPEQAARRSAPIPPSMPLNDITLALDAAIRAIAADHTGSV